jgi:hypothetical protein
VSQHSRAVGVILLLVSAWALSAAPARAQLTVQELQAEQAQAAQCAALRAQAESLSKSQSNANEAATLTEAEKSALSESIAATEVQISRTCLLNGPPPPPVVCGTDENGSGTGTAEYIQVHASIYARWCVDATFWPANAQYISQFFAYYDGVVRLLSSLFNVKLPLPILVEVSTPRPNGSVCTCGPIFGEPVGLRMTGDAFSNVFVNPQNNQSVPGFWGYLLPLHEAINSYTGQVGRGNWPTDWWADDLSPFPNAMDELVMRNIGNAQKNQTLLNAASAQHERFTDPSQSGYSPETAMFVNFYNQYGGFAAYARFFGLVRKDGIQWQSVSQDPTFTPDHNYSKLLSEYVIAYLSLAFRVKSDLTPTFAKAGVGTGYTNFNIQSYTLNSAAVKDIAKAHCSIRAASAAGVNVDSQLTALQKGNYMSAIASGGTKLTCPNECLWSQNKCVARW